MENSPMSKKLRYRIRLMLDNNCISRPINNEKSKVPYVDNNVNPTK